MTPAEEAGPGLDADDADDQAADAVAEALAEVAGPAFVPFYGSVEEWVADAFTTTYLRRSGSPTFRWCPSWWAHPEAVVRLAALWRGWEELRLDGLTGMGTWYRDHLDHQLPILCGPAGPFASCHPAHVEHNPRRLALTPPPADWWDVHDPTADSPNPTPKGRP